MNNCRGHRPLHFKQTHNKTVKWDETYKLTERVLKNQSWPLYPQLQLQSILLLECHGLFSPFFPWTCPLRGGRIDWVHGRGHYLPTCISIRVTTAPATLTGLREHWIKTCCSHRELSAHISEREGPGTSEWLPVAALCPGEICCTERAMWEPSGCGYVFILY